LADSLVGSCTGTSPSRVPARMGRMAFHNYPIRRLAEDPTNVLDRRQWPAVLPPVAQVLDQGLDLTSATILVGENGSGKSTLVEAIALAYGLSPEGGSTGARHATRATESVLADHLQLVRNAGTTRRGYFLRAETMHGFFTYLEKTQARPGRTSHSTTCLTGSPSWNWRWIALEGTDCGYLTNLSLRCPSQDVSALLQF
jgi:hypothetical protein